MEHPCHNCSAPVDDGVAFCPQCNAPQIRVSSAMPELLPAGALPLRPIGEIDWPQAFSAAALSGIGCAIFAVLTTFLLGGAFLVWMIIAGAICVALYRRKRPMMLLRAGIGARIGAVSGLFGGLTFAVLQSLAFFAARGNDEVRQQFRQKLEEAAARNPDPGAQEMVRWLLTPEGLVFVIVLGMLFILVVSVAFGAIGGGLWASRGPAKQK